ncbi:MAG: hypothetical protein IKJ99_05300 [Oscillospiraceae bacterium]|nr:hypothetical protein [Oscillospiraceae bacterium]
MTDRDFELLLQESLDELPPSDELVDAVNPWRTAMNRILWGMGLVTITLNFLALNTILPAIGTILMLLGYRTLRQENRWFGFGYVLVILRTIWLMIHIFFDATIYSGDFAATNFAITGSYLQLVIGFVHLICLRGGIRAVQKKAGLEPHAGSATALIIWYVIITALALMNFEGYSVYVLLIAYICILRGLWKLSKALDDAGYVVSAAPSAIRDQTVAIAYTAVIALMLTIGFTCFSQYPMEWEIRQDKAESHQELLDLGFPEYVLQDLNEEELRRCENAAKVYVDMEEVPVTDGYQVYGQRRDGSYIYTEYTAKELLITAVAVEPENPEDDWLIIHHFLWTEDPGYRGTEAIQIWPAYMKNDGWVSGNYLSGRVLHDRDGATYTAPYRRLDEISYSYTWFFGTNDSTDIIATFSLPRKGENCRGYVCYGAKEVEKGWLLNSWCNYFYQQTFLQFPVGTAEEAVLSHNFGHNEAIKANQTAIQMSQEERDNS